MPPADNSSFLTRTLSGGTDGRWIGDDRQRLDLDTLRTRHFLKAPLADFKDRSVLIACQRQLPAVLAALALDGIARRIVLGLPDLAANHLSLISGLAEVDVVISEKDCHADPAAARAETAERRRETEWILLTSGTTGAPKLVRHTLATLAGPLDDKLVAKGSVWSTFYDVRRYGGLQMLFRALIGGGSMILSSPTESVADFLARLARGGITHVSGTPSHWRKVLMSGRSSIMSPRYVRLSGEIADQAVLDQLRAAYPNAEVAHAFASTEAGVAFDVRDGRAGFPVSYIERPPFNVELRLVDDSLRIRSSRTALGYLGSDAAFRDKDGFVDTGDLLAREGDRYHFIGRREGVINVGGQKVFPEEVEAAINSHPAVRVSRVRGRRSPITGALVAAEIVTRNEAEPGDALRESILQHCRERLQPHKVPVSLRFVPELAVATSGKLKRQDA